MISESDREYLAKYPDGEWFFRPDEPSGPPWRAPLDRFAGALYYKVLLCASLSHLFLKPLEPKDEHETAEKERRERKTVFWATVYILITTGGIVALWLIYPGNETWKLIFAGLAAWRLMEIFTYGLGTALKYNVPKLQDWVAIALYAFSVTLCYAILDHSLATNDYKLVHGSPEVASGSFTFLYIAWTHMTTLGNGYELTSDTARALAMASTTSGVLILAVLVASALNRIPGATPGRGR
jgi:hypothetical protein